MQIRDMQESDRAGVIRLWEACGLTRPWNDPSQDITRSLGAANATILLGEESGAIIASTMLGFDGHRGWVYYFAVAPERQRNGLGRLLFNASEVWLQERGAPKIQLMVRDSNEAAIGFYRALGLEVQPVVTLGRFLDREPVR